MQLMMEDYYCKWHSQVPGNESAPDEMKNEAMEDEGEKVNNKFWDQMLGGKDTMQTHSGR